MEFASEDVERIFEKFINRVPRVESADEPGTGPWTSVLFREIMDSHGGYVTVESEVGVGSTFTAGVYPVELKDGNNLKKNRPDG